MIRRACLIACLTLAFVGCTTAPILQRRDDVDVILAHPQARAVAEKYPQFFSAVLNTIADLDTLLARRAKPLAAP